MVAVLQLRCRLCDRLAGGLQLNLAQFEMAPGPNWVPPFTTRHLVTIINGVEINMFAPAFIADRPPNKWVGGSMTGDVLTP